MNRTHFASLAALPLTALSCVCASADDMPNNTVRVGSYTVFFHAHADDLSGPYVPSGTNIKVDNVETAYFAYVRRLNPSFEVELALGWPPKTKTEGSGPAALGSVAYNGQVISTARWFSPTLLFNYKFFDDNTKLRPYIGVGVNYTNFYDRDSTAAGDAASGGPTKISLTSSVGPAGTVGLSYAFAPRWSAFASYSISQVKSDLKADTAGVIRTTHVSFGPQALILSVGYSFGR
jgi:outer membrane protein